MQRVANQLEKIPVDQRLARIFNHVSGEENPHFELADYLNKDVVLILDTGGLWNEAQRMLTLVVLSNLWTAMRRRAQRPGDTNEYQLVNIYLEEGVLSIFQEYYINHSTVTKFQLFGDARDTVSRAVAGRRQRVSRELLNNVSTDAQLLDDVERDSVKVPEQRYRSRSIPERGVRGLSRHARLEKSTARVGL